MAIRRVLRRRPSDELPPAKLYLDDVREIVDILAAPTPGASASAQSDVALRFRVRGSECDTLEDLEKLGGRARKFEILVSYGSQGYQYSGIRSDIMWTRLILSVPPNAWEKETKIKQIFDANVIWWKNIFFRLPDWFIYLLPMTAVPLIVVVRRFGVNGRTEDVIEGCLFAVFTVPFLCKALGGSVLILRYAHTHGIRRWFEEHGNQLFFLIVGALLATFLKPLAEWLWRLVSH